MIVTGHQPNYLPYLGFFHKIISVDTFVLVDTVQYVKRGPFGWMNRNKIRTPEGWQWLTVPVLSKGKYTQLVKETQIDNSKDWSRKHWRSIEAAYRQAPYFSKHSDFFKQIYHQPWEYLSDLSETIIRYVLEQLGVKVKITKTSLLGVQGKGTDLIIAICEKLGAEAYVHGQHGKDYVDQSQFTRHNIKCIWQDFQHPVYQQLYQPACRSGRPFIPELSVIDLLFNHGPESLDILRGKS